MRFPIIIWPYFFYLSKQQPLLWRMTEFLNANIVKKLHISEREKNGHFLSTPRQSHTNWFSLHSKLRDPKWGSSQRTALSLPLWDSHLGKCQGSHIFHMSIPLTLLPQLRETPDTNWPSFHKSLLRACTVPGAGEAALTTDRVLALAEFWFYYSLMKVTKQVEHTVWWGVMQKNKAGKGPWGQDTFNFK